MTDKDAAHVAAIAANRHAWDIAASEHLKAPDWQAQLSGFVSPGYSTFDDTMTTLLRAEGLAGKSVVQPCCNNGREVLSLAAFGAARCLGIDQSAAFLEQAETLRAVAGSDATFLCADIYALPGDVPRDFDVALITIGVLNWMPDLARFFDAVAGLVKPSGRLIIYETHPFLELFDPEADDPMTLAWSYFDEDPVMTEESITYDGSSGGETAPTYWFVHRIGQILNALIGAGFVLRRMDEYPHSNREAEYDLYEGQEAQLPMCYTLLADKA
jgi:SAM-dependent methyltransferase